MARTTALRNALAQAYADLADHISLHDGDPGTTGANDTGVTHAALTWTSSPSGGVVTSDEAVFSVPASTTITHVGVWDASSNFLESFTYSSTITVLTSLHMTVRHTEPA